MSINALETSMSPVATERDTIVIKVGSKLVSSESNGNGEPDKLDLNFLRDLSQNISRIIEETGNRVILVSSGAVASGKELLTLPGDMDRIVRNQIYASVGQPRLMGKYVEFLRTGKPPRLAGQLLLTWANFANETERSKILRTITSQPKNIVTIANENDPIADEELTLKPSPQLGLSDNDQLASLLAQLVRAKILIILSDVEGVFDRNPQEPGAVLIPQLSVDDLTDEFIEACAKGGNELGRGGMASKVRAAKAAAEQGVLTVIARGKHNGKNLETLRDIVWGTIDIGTRISPRIVH